MIILVGKTCSGKSTIADLLEKTYGIHRVRTYTTRPKREGETNEYHFVSEEEFEELRSKDFFFETTKYEVASGEIWHYGTANEDLVGKSCIVMNPEGMKKACKLLPREKDIKVIYLNVTEGTLWNRLRLRGDNSDEAVRRIEADKNDFKNIDEYYDYAITTDNLTPEEIVKIIFYIL